MSDDRKNFRIACYVAAGGIFIGLLAMIFSGMARFKDEPKPEEDQKFTKKKSGAVKLSDISWGKSDRKKSSRVNLPSEKEPDDPKRGLPGEVILKGNSEQELIFLLTRAMDAGGKPEDIIKKLLTAKVKFDTPEQAQAFRDALGDGDVSDNNYVVLAPEFPDTEGGTNAPRATPGDEREGGNVSGENLLPFGDRALQFLGVEDDNSNWGHDLTIAILDSGVYPHDSLMTGIEIKQLDLVGTPEDPQADYTGHGTAVADIAHTVAPGADLLSVRVLDSDGVGDTFNVAQGIVAAVDNGARVINLSLGSYGDSIVLQDAVNYALDNGAAVVAATGNDGIEQVSYPAAYDGVIGVSAVDAAGQFADFSNSGDTVDFGAPGVGVLTAWEEDGQANFSGTSAAAPFVAGAIAATMTNNPGFTTEQAIQRLQQNAQDSGEAGVDTQTGHGILNLER